MRGDPGRFIAACEAGRLRLATSDHGFIELPPDTALVVNHAEVTSHQAKFIDTVFYRYAKRFKPSAMNPTVACRSG